jgi:molybdenum cofactor cytidylyltransferase
MHIVGVLLAAGSGSRFGGDKLLAPLPEEDEAIGVAACRHLLAALPDSVAVVRAGDRALAAMLGELGARVVECADADRGMGRSLACGVAAAREADGFVVALADMPWVRASTIDAVAQALRDGAPVAVAVVGERRGHPVGFAASYAAALLALDGDRGARDLVASAGTALCEVEVDDDGAMRDVDVPDDLAR